MKTISKIILAFFLVATFSCRRHSPNAHAVQDNVKQTSDDSTLVDSSSPVNAPMEGDSVTKKSMSSNPQLIEDPDMMEAPEQGKSK